MEPEHLKNILESLLFVASQPLKAKALARFLEVEEAAVQAAFAELVAERREAGVVVLENNGEYQMATQPKNSTQVKNFLNAELREKLTDATVEVLAIIAYRQPISKAEIEAIRGVNSQYSVRHLLMRGLVEKIPNPHDARSFLYQTTTEFLQHMGLVSVADLPEFSKLVEQVKLPETPQAQEVMESTEADAKQAGLTAAAGLADTQLLPNEAALAAEPEPAPEEAAEPAMPTENGQAAGTPPAAPEPPQAEPTADYDPTEIANAQEEFGEEDDDEDDGDEE